MNCSMNLLYEILNISLIKSNYIFQRKDFAAFRAAVADTKMFLDAGFAKGVAANSNARVPVLVSVVFPQANFTRRYQILNGVLE